MESPIRDFRLIFRRKKNSTPHQRNTVTPVRRRQHWRCFSVLAQHSAGAQLVKGYALLEFSRADDHNITFENRFLSDTLKITNRDFDLCIYVVCTTELEENTLSTHLFHLSRSIKNIYKLNYAV